MHLPLPRRFVALLLATSLAAASAVHGGASPRTAEAAAAALALPNASCSGSSATVSFAWTPPAGATETWLDLSSNDNGFVSGSYQNAGPLAGNASSYTWSGLKTYTPYFWRVDSKLSSGWVASETGIFVACSEPILLASNPDCTSNSEATVSFRWAPSVPPTRGQWLDVSTQGSFNAGTFTSYALSPGANSLTIDKLQSNGYAYRVMSQLQDGSSRSSITRTFVADCASGVDIDLHHTGDTLVYSALGISAPVNVRKVGPDGAMLNPEGKDDVVRYEYSPSTHPGLGGYPGNGGTTVLAAHLDYRPYYPAAFYYLTRAKKGDLIEYRRADGVTKKFVVDWVGSIAFDDPSLRDYLRSTNPETIVLLTCDGSFDESHGGYDRRAMVYATAVP